MCATEPLDKICEERLLEYRRILPVLPSYVKPVRLMEKSCFPGMVDVYIVSMDAHYLCVVNWNDTEELRVDLCVKKLLPEFASDEEEYLICDYYAGKYYDKVKADVHVLSEAIAPHGAAIFKVVKRSDMPQVVCSDGHYSMGGEFERLQLQDGKLAYTVENPFPYTIKYTVMLPDGGLVELEAKQGRNEGCL